MGGAVLKKRGAGTAAPLSQFSDEALRDELRRRAAPDRLAGSRYNLREGMRSSEVLIIRRALGFYVNAYTDMKREAEDAHSKAEHQLYIEAAHRLDDKLLRDLIVLPFTGDSLT